MFTRRNFMQGTALGGLALAMPRHLWAGQGAAVTIDSADTPLHPATPGSRHLRLSGSQLQRFEELRHLFADSAPLRITARLDAPAELLLDTALNSAGKSICHRERNNGVLSFTAL